jgi:hypothetical protein
MKLNIFKTLALGALVMGFASCEKDYEKSTYDLPIPEGSILPTVTVASADAFGESALIEATKGTLEGATPTNWGVLVSTSPVPSLAGSIKVEGDITKDSQTFAVSGLTDGTTYYYRSFVTDGVGIAYSETKEFKTDGAAWGTEEGYWAFNTEDEANGCIRKTWWDTYMLPTPTTDVVKTYVCPQDGVLAMSTIEPIKAADLLDDTDGIRVCIRKNDEAVLDWQEVPLFKPLPCHIYTVAVKAGDKIYFRVNHNQIPRGNTASWAPFVYYI